MGPDAGAFMDAAAQHMEALAALGRDERFHPAILEATHRGAELAALLGLTNNCPALEEPLVRLVAALACLGDDATRHALIDTGAVDILIYQLLHRVSGTPKSDSSPPASGPCPLLGPCVSVCLGALASLALVSNCAKQLMAARRLPQFLARVIAAAEAAAVAANAAGELPPAGAAAADLLAVLQEGTVAGSLFASGSPPHDHALAAAGGCDAAGATDPAHICVAPHPRVAAAAAAVAEGASSPRTPHSTPVAAGGMPVGPLAGSPSPLRRVAVSTGGGGGSFGGDAPRISWVSGAGAFPVPDPAAIERGVAELVTRVRAATLSDPRTQAPRHALDEKLSGSRWAALGSLALAGGGGSCMGGSGSRAPATNLSVVPGGTLGGGAAAEPGAAPFNSPAPRGGAFGAASPVGGASRCASLTSTMRAGGTGPGPSLRSTLKSSGALAAALGGAPGGATPFNSPMRASEGGGRAGGAFIGAGGSALQRLLAEQQQQQQHAAGGGMASALSTLSLATPANSPAAGLHGSGRYGAPPCSSMSAMFGGASPLTTLTRSGSPGRGMHDTRAAGPLFAAAATAAAGAQAEAPHGGVWGSDCGALNVATAEDAAAAALRRSVVGGSMGGAGSPVRTSSPAPASFLQPMHAERQSLAGAACGGSLPHVDSLVCPSLLSPYSGTGAQPQHEGHAPGAGGSAGGAPSPCGRCGRLMSNCCHCSAAGAVAGDAPLAAAAAAVALRSAAGPSAGGAVEVSRALFGDATEASAETPVSGSSRRSVAAAAAAAEGEGEAPRGGCLPAPFESVGTAGPAAAAPPAAGAATWSWVEQLRGGGSTTEGDGAAGAAQGEGLQGEGDDAAYPPIKELSAALGFSQSLQQSGSRSSARASAHSTRQQVAAARGPSARASEAAAAADAAWGLPGGHYDLSGASDLRELAARLEAAGSGAEEGPLEAAAAASAAKVAGGSIGGSYRRQAGRAAEDAGPYELEESEWAAGEEAAGQEAEYPTVFI